MAKGKLTQSAKDALEAAGIDWRGVGEEDIIKINKAITKGAKFTDKVRGRKAQLTAEDIDATLGMITQRPDLIREELITAEGIRKWGDAADQFAARGNEQFPGADPAAFNRAVNTRARSDMRASDAAFETARRTSETVPVPERANDLIEDGMRARLKQDLSDPEIEQIMAGFPKAPKGEIVKIEGPDGKVIHEFTMPADENPNTYRELFEWRRAHLADSDVAGKGRKAFDAELQRMIDRQLAGDMGPEAIMAWQQANRGYDEFTDFWRAGDLIEKIVQRDSQGYALKSDPKSTWNLLFNSGKAGFVKKKDLGNAIRKVQEIFGEGSPEAQSMRDALLRRVSTLDTGLVAETKRAGYNTINSKPLKKAWEDQKVEWGAELDAAFPPEMITRMDNFVTKAGWVDQARAGAAPLQPSGLIGLALKRISEATFRFFRAGTRQAAETLRKGKQAMQEADLAGPTYRDKLPYSSLGIPVAETDEVLWDEVYNDILREAGVELPDDLNPYLPNRR
jgi:hypothetical protein